VYRLSDSCCTILINKQMSKKENNPSTCSVLIRKAN